tara:strand:- start:180 stop:614 length:435 start_codon:yes stop_codon:yes gene_type:complete
MTRLLITILIFLFFSFGNLKMVFAVDDGIYTGVFKMTYGHGHSTSKRGDTGIFEFHISNNKIIKITTPDISGWNRNAIRYFFKINPESNELVGHCSVSDSNNGSTYDVILKGIFMDKKFAGEGKVMATSPESVLLNKFVFEDIN